MRNSEKMAVAKSSINSLLKENEVVENELDNLEETCVTQKNFEERVVETVSQIPQRQMQQQQHHSLFESETPLAESGFDAASKCKLEAIEQYNRRVCRLFLGLYEMEVEDCTEKVVQTDHAMGVNITAQSVTDYELESAEKTNRGPL